MELSHIGCGRGWWSLYKCERKPYLLSWFLRLKGAQDHPTLIGNDVAYDPHGKDSVSQFDSVEDYNGRIKLNKPS